MEIQVINETDIGQRLDEEIRQGLCECFPPDKEIFSKTRSWHGSFPAWCVLVLENDQILAHVGIVDRVIEVNHDHRLRIAGIQNVYVLPAGRGKGLCDKLMIKSMEEAESRGFDCGLLFCIPDIQKVYSRCGWQLLPREKVIRVDESGQDVELPTKNIAMFYPLKVTEFPPGRIHLQGNDW